SLASTLNTAASPPAWIGDNSGRSFKAGLVQHPASAFFAVFVFMAAPLLHYYIIQCNSWKSRAATFLADLDARPGMSYVGEVPRNFRCLTARPRGKKPK